jgi:hypothetical protein
LKAKVLKILNFEWTNLDNLLITMSPSFSLGKKVPMANQLIPIVHHKHEIVNVDKGNLNKKKRKDDVCDRLEIFEIVFLFLSINLFESHFDRFAIFDYQ